MGGYKGYDMMDFFQGVELEENPDAALQLMLFILLMALLVGIGIFIAKWPKIKRRLWDEELFTFLLDFKELTNSERNIVTRIIKENKIKPKYRLLIMEPVLQKYIDYEISKLNHSNIDMLEKEEKEHKYLELKQKLFPTDTVEVDID